MTPTIAAPRAPRQSRSEIMQVLRELTEMHQRLRIAAERLGVDDPEIASLRDDIIACMMQGLLELMALEMEWASTQAIH